MPRQHAIKPACIQYAAGLLEAANDDGGKPTLRATPTGAAAAQQAPHAQQAQQLAERSGSGGSPGAAAGEARRVKVMLQQAKVGMPGTDRVESLTDGSSCAQAAADSLLAGPICSRRAWSILSKMLTGFLRCLAFHSLQACWMRAGHPGWALLALETPAFEQWAHRQQASAAELPSVATLACNTGVACPMLPLELRIVTLNPSLAGPPDPAQRCGSCSDSARASQWSR